MPHALATKRAKKAKAKSGRGVVRRNGIARVRLSDAIADVTSVHGIHRQVPKSTWAWRRWPTRTSRANRSNDVRTVRTLATNIFRRAGRSR